MGVSESEGVTKATLEIEGGDTFDCLFNPKDYTVTKTNNWKAEPKQGETAAIPSFTGGTPWEITLQLLFDTSLLKEHKEVRTLTGKLFDAMDATRDESAGSPGKKTTKRPPKITFDYGGFKFVGVAKNLSVQYTLFTQQGVPIRADVKLTLMQCNPKQEKGQNPTTLGEGGLGAHVVRDGDSLASIAHQVYGDATQWRTIAQANGIDDPLRLRSGRMLSVPRLDA
jgi:Contractile injection system tube protein/LysM domain